MRWHWQPWQRREEPRRRCVSKSAHGNSEGQAQILAAKVEKRETEVVDETIMGAALLEVTELEVTGLEVAAA